MMIEESIIIDRVPKDCGSNSLIKFHKQFSPVPEREGAGKVNSPSRCVHPMISGADRLDWFASRCPNLLSTSSLHGHPHNLHYQLIFMESRMRRVLVSLSAWNIESGFCCNETS